MPAPSRALSPSVRGSIASDGRRLHIITADVKGRFQTLRTLAFVLLIAVWVALPMVHINGAPALFLDIEARKFFILGLTFNAQDAPLVFFLLSGVGFGFVYITALAGRAWCGWMCPQTVFLEGVYRRIERLLEGSRDARLRRKKGSAGAIARATLKHLVFLVISVGVAHIILAYFVSIPRLFQMMRTNPGAHAEAFAWVVALSAVSYANFAWFREQFCVVMCPYGRLQSALLDKHSIVVGYDALRGEPRGKKGKTEGACVDCKRCVVVCPTAIDIREGLQLDCIGCTACIDACDTVMDKLGRPRGLIRYDSEEGLAGRPRHIIRPRIIGYTVAMLVGALVLGFAIRARNDFEATISRLRGAPYKDEAGVLQNAFDIHLVNKRGEALSFTIVANGADGISPVLPIKEVKVEAMGAAHVPLFLSMPKARFDHDLPFTVTVEHEGANGKGARNIEVRFLGSRI